MRSTDNDFFYDVTLWKKNGLMKHYHINYINLEMMLHDFDHILFLKFDSPSYLASLNVTDLIKSLDKIYESYTNPFVILTERRPAPKYVPEIGENVYSFSCDYSDFRTLISRYVATNLTCQHLLFDLLDGILQKENKFTNILTKQVPLEDEDLVFK